MAAVRRAFVARHVGHELFTASAKSCDDFEAGWALTSVTGHRARVATLLLNLAWTFAARHRYATLNWRVKLNNAAGAPKRVR